VIVNCVVIRRSPLTFCALVLSVAVAHPARGNNAFPDTGQVILPPDRPEMIVVGTNFGLVITEDGGATWRWSCEHDEGVGGVLYELAPGPRHRLLTIGNGMAFSDDLACTWQTPEPNDPFIYDVFADPGTPDRYLVAVDRVEGGQSANVIVETTDGGHTMGRVLFTAPAGLEVSTLELARSNPQFIYATLYPLSGPGPTRIARSTDGGASWSVVTPVSDAGNHDLWIAAIDQADPKKIYLRVLTGDGKEKLAISEDGGDTLGLPLMAEGALSSFVRMADGTILVGALAITDGHVFRSTDGGKTFAPTAAKIHPRALAERGGKVYASTDSIADGFALAVSEDHGDTWKRVMGLQDIGSISQCGNLPSVCLNSCAMLKLAGLVRPALCGAAPGPDAGVGGAGGDPGGCSCRTGSGAGSPAVALIALGLLALRRRRR
jgi:MYXO-CTERM domain-containing protein